MVVRLRFAAAASLSASAFAGAQCSAPLTPEAASHDREEPRDSDVSLLQVTVQSAVKMDMTEVSDLQQSSPALQDQRLWGAGNMSVTIDQGLALDHVGNMSVSSPTALNRDSSPIGDALRRKMFAAGQRSHLKIAERPSDSWPHELDGKSVLVLGDSLDRNAVRYLCHTHQAATGPYLQADLSSLVGASSYDFCRVGGVTVGQFMNYGVFEPPYWMYAYKEMNVHKHFMVPDGLQDTSDQHILLDASRFKSVTPGGQDPTLVVVQSCLWDLASDWQHAGGMVQGYRPADDFVSRWAAKLQHQMLLVRRIFPTSRLAWRTASPNPEPGTNQDVIHLYTPSHHVYPDLIRSMNDAARAFATENGVELVDYASMAEAPGGPTIHGMAYMNALLNILEEHA